GEAGRGATVAAEGELEEGRGRGADRQARDGLRNRVGDLNARVARAHGLQPNVRERRIAVVEEVDLDGRQLAVVRHVVVVTGVGRDRRRARLIHDARTGGGYGGDAARRLRGAGADPISVARAVDYAGVVVVGRSRHG